MEWFFGMTVSILALIGLTAVGYWTMKKVKGLVGIAIALGIIGFLGLALLNGLMSGQGLGWPVAVVPAVLASVGDAWLVSLLFRSGGSQPGHGHGAGHGNQQRRIDWRLQVAGVIVGAAVMVGIWWGFLTGLPAAHVTNPTSTAPTTAVAPQPKEDFDLKEACRGNTKAARANLRCAEHGY